MNSQNGVNIFCLCIGIALFLFALIGALGLIPGILYASRVWLMFFFSVIIILWSGLSLYRHRK